MRLDQHIHDIFDLYLFMEREKNCDDCKLFQDNVVGNLVNLYDEFSRANSKQVESEEKKEGIK